MAAKTPGDYSNLITSWHASRGPRFVDTVETNAKALAAVQALLESFPEAFDIDKAIGAQLDILGQWIGRSRRVLTPIYDPWFAFDDPKRGFDVGIWKDAYSLGDLLTLLPDDVYRRLLYAKIALNHWDGQILTAEEAIRKFFGPSDAFVWVEDRLDMSYAVCFAGAWPLKLFALMVEENYTPAKTAGMRTYYQVTSIDRAPLFGFDCSNSYVAGFDQGAWGISPTLFARDIAPY